MSSINFSKRDREPPPWTSFILALTFCLHLLYCSCFGYLGGCNPVTQLSTEQLFPEVIGLFKRNRRRSGDGALMNGTMGHWYCPTETKGSLQESFPFACDRPYAPGSQWLTDRNKRASKESCNFFSLWDKQHFILPLTLEGDAAT